MAGYDRPMASDMDELILQSVTEQRNLSGRATVRGVAERVGRPVATVHRRMVALVDDGRLLVDPGSYGTWRLTEQEAP